MQINDHYKAMQNPFAWNRRALMVDHFCLGTVMKQYGNCVIELIVFAAGIHVLTVNESSVIRFESGQLLIS